MVLCMLYSTHTTYRFLKPFQTIRTHILWSILVFDKKLLCKPTKLFKCCKLCAIQLGFFADFPDLIPVFAGYKLCSKVDVTAAEGDKQVSGLCHLLNSLCNMLKIGLVFAIWQQRHQILCIDIVFVVCFSCSINRRHYNVVNLRQDLGKFLHQHFRS